MAKKQRTRFEKLIKDMYGFYYWEDVDQLMDDPEFRCSRDYWLLKEMMRAFDN